MQDSAVNIAASATAVGSGKMEVGQLFVGQYQVEARAHQVDSFLSPLHQSVHT